MPTFVLIHMSEGGRWAWGTVPNLLGEVGHRAIVPNLELVAGQTPQTHADAVAAEAAGHDDLVIAGHSYGGMVAPLVADRLAGRVRCLVVVDGLMPEAGESAFDLRPGQEAARRAAAEARGDGRWPPRQLRAGDPQWRARLAPMPISAFETPVEPGEAAASTPGTFIHCLRSDMGEQAERARRRGWRVVEVDAGHVLPLELPARCALLLVQAAEAAK